MIITCPSCSNRYKVDPAKFGPKGRRVRCSKCSHVWIQKPADDLPKAIEPEPAMGREVPPEGGAEAGAEAGPRAPSPVMAARIRARQAARESEAESRSNRLGWALLVLVVCAVIGGGVLARDTIVRVWPPAERLYSLVGLKAPTLGAGLRIKVVSHDRLVEGETAFLVVKGEITNTSSSVRDVPKLRASLRANDASELMAWTFSTAQARLLPGETAPFATRLENPAPDAVALNIDFLADKR